MTSFGSDLILARLRRLHPKAIDLSLDRMWRILAALDHPERLLAPVVHIAGTNGKGSTLAFLDAMLRSRGLRTQRYVSPHLVHFNERILFDGEPIDEEALAQALDVAERANQGAPITEFEITTAAAFVAFAARPADALLIETGLGGRLDATNVFEAPGLCALSPISLDHQGFLGETIEQIAFEKAGILKPGVRAVVGPQRPDALAVIERQALRVGAPLLIHGHDWAVKAAGERFIVASAMGPVELPAPALVGRHQFDNAGLAVMLGRLFEPQLGSTDIESGLSTARWPARLQRLTGGALLDGLYGSGIEVWLDGGHNPAAGEALAVSMAGDTRPLTLIVGMLKTKDLSGFLAPLSRVAAALIAVPVPDEPASRAPDEIVHDGRKLGLPSAGAADVQDALAMLRERGRSGRVLICGSLYLAGAVLRANQTS
ncbi:MAG: folylpolyglutamate synthase/dihydrofolate synthase family protein [Geminicoccaceae bacterium]|nr:folylpolyglutamate synthase/dihydrofolate synthase family protein [Geminicoccaceae bacterium]